MSKLKNMALILVPAVITFPLSQIIWKNPADAISPTSGQLPFFILLGVLESLAFGAGVLFLIKGYQWLQNAQVSKSLTVWAYLAISWGLVSWWPHDNLHRANGMNTQGLLYIEYGFHVTLMISAAIIAYFFIQALKTKQQPA